MSHPPGSILVAPLAGHAARAAFRIDRPGRSCQRLIWGRHLKPLYGVIIVNPEQAWSFRSVPPGRGSKCAISLPNRSRSRLTAKRRRAFAPRLTLGLDESQLAPANRGTGPSKQKGIMNCSAKELNGTDLPNRWTVEVIYRDGSL